MVQKRRSKCVYTVPLSSNSMINNLQELNGFPNDNDEHNTPSPNNNVVIRF